jgi:predicted transglutaminase-like cysteine proteinase
MPGVTQPTEYPGKYLEKLEALVKIKKENSRGKWTPKIEEEYRVICKQALIIEAEDKINFSLRGEIRRGKPAKLGMSVDEFETTWRKKMKDRLTQDGFPFELTKDEQAILERIRDEVNQRKVNEMTNMAAETLKKMITTS